MSMQNNIRKGLCFFALTLSVAAMVASARPSDWYGRLGGGFSWKNDTNISYTQPTALTSDGQFDLGYNYSGALGYAHAPFIYEVELTYLRSPLNRLTQNGTVNQNPDGSARAFAQFLNVYYSFNLTHARLVPYLGIGLGSIHLRDTDLHGSGLYLADETVMGYQGIAGLGFRVNQLATLAVDYRYIGSQKVDYVRNFVQPSDLSVQRRFSSNTLNLSFIYRLY